MEKTKLLLTGDAEWDLEHDLIEVGYDLSATVLKVGHHGSDDSSSYAFIQEVMPQYAIISEGKDNPYGQSTDAVLSRLRDTVQKFFGRTCKGIYSALALGMGLLRSSP